MPPYNRAKVCNTIRCNFALFLFKGMSVAEQSKSDASQTWWKNAYVWMVLGGPLAVIVASITTFFIAANNPDPVLDTNAKTAEVTKTGVAPSEDAMVPALVGRNNAATGGVVPDKK